MAAYLQVTLKHSGIGRTQRQKETLRGLGLRRLHQSRILQDTPAIRGMIGKVNHLVQWQESKSAQLEKNKKVTTYQLGAMAEPAPKKAKAPAAKTPAKKKSTSTKEGAKKQTKKVAKKES